MKTFYAIVHKDEGSAYGVHFPELVGCFSAADTVNGILPAAQEALTLWFEDQEQFVEPLPIGDIAEAAKEDLADGAFILGVPFIPPAGKSVRVNITMNQSILDAIDKAAGDLGVSRSAFLAAASQSFMAAQRQR